MVGGSLFPCILFIESVCDDEVDDVSGFRIRVAAGLGV
jgi:hypothetical protein